MPNEYKDWELEKIEEEKQYVEKYPFLRVRDINGNIVYDSKWPMISLEIPDGWYELFFQMCDDIKDLVPEDFYFIQVKEKYNKLRCHVANSTPEVDHILAKYEQMAYYVCTVCGAPADVVSTDYIASFCNSCCKNNFRHERVEQLKLSTVYLVCAADIKRGGTRVETFSFKDTWDRYLNIIKS